MLASSTKRQRQIRLARIMCRIVRLRCAIPSQVWSPLRRGINSDIEAPESESERRAKIVIDVFTLMICVAHMKHRSSSVQSIGGTDDFDRGAGVVEVLVFRGVGTGGKLGRFGGGTGRDGGEPDVEVAVVVDVVCSC